MCVQPGQTGPDRRNPAVLFILLLTSTCLACCTDAMVTLGQEREKARFPGCSEDESRCPDEVTEAFNTFGSWMVTFGIGAVRSQHPTAERLLPSSAVVAPTREC